MSRWLELTIASGRWQPAGNSVQARCLFNRDEKVTDSVTGDPVPDAQISIEGSGISTTANAFGRFESSGIATGQSIVLTRPFHSFGGGALRSDPTRQRAFARCRSSDQYDGEVVAIYHLDVKTGSRSGFADRPDQHRSVLSCTRPGWCPTLENL